MRRLIALAVLAGAAAAAACASMGTPPGGPPDKAPPQLLTVTPDSGALNTRPGKVVFQFDETINDRAARGALDQYFLISPMDGAPRVSYHRSRLEVRPRHGFRPNTAYTVTLLPGLSDIRGNVSNVAHSIVFSTGAEIPRFGILGHVFDWAAQRPLANAIVEAVSLPDSTVYIVAADSLGGYDLSPLPAGRFRLLAWADQNKNRARDRNEIFDTTTVVVTTSRPIVELLAIARDTLPPRLSSVAPDDSLTLRLVFDRALDPTQPYATTQFRVIAADSALATVARVLTLAQADQEHADSARRADSLAAAHDTAAARRARSDTARPPVPVPGTGRAIALTPPKPSRPAPPTTLLVRLAPQTPLRPGTSYRVTATDIRSLVGIPGTSARVINVPKPPPPDTTRRSPADTAKRAPADTAKRPPADTAKRPPADTARRPAAPPRYSQAETRRARLEARQARFESEVSSFALRASDLATSAA